MLTDHQRARERTAILWLLVACALWGMSFNWNKEAQSLLGDRLAAGAGDPGASAVGPAAFLGVRFPIAAVLWVVVFPRSLRGWSWRTVFAGVIAGALLSGGMLLQHYGLSYTSESLSAFLTSLTVLFTPIMGATMLRHRIGGGLWVSVLCATVGVALMTLGRDEGRFDVGALLGLLCAVVFSAHILCVDRFGQTEDPWRFTLAQFAAASLIFVGFWAAYDRSGRTLDPAIIVQAMALPRMLGLTGLAVVLATLATFGIMFRFQPRTTPTRAALTYLTEPLFATGYAWMVANRPITSAAMIGGALVLLGNMLAEVLSRRMTRREAPIVS
jgi:drug/metabolite transporter (DMT)-like permease